MRAGRSDELDEEFVGVDLLIDLGRINFNPNVEYYLLEDDNFGSNTNAATVNADFTLDFGTAAVRPYVGLGVGLFWVDSDFGDDTETLANALGGVQFDLDFLKPYAQVKYSRSLEDSDGDNDDISFVIGLRF